MRREGKEGGIKREGREGGGGGVHIMREVGRKGEEKGCRQGGWGSEGQGAKYATLALLVLPLISLSRPPTVLSAEMI